MASLHAYLSLTSSTLSLAFLLLLPRRLRELNKQAIKVRPGSWRGLAKLAATLLFFCVQVITTFLSTSRSPHTAPYITGVSSIAAFCVVFLSFTEHRRSVRPSGLVLLYIFSSLICDVIQLTVPSLRSLEHYIRLCLALQLGAKTIVFCTELLGKESYLLDEWRDLPPEETTSVFGSAFVWWINPILAKGYRNTLLNEELPEVDHELSSAVLREKILRIWSHSDSPWLPLVLAKCLLRPALLVAVWRSCMIVTTYAQPALISYSIAFLKSPDKSPNDGYFVVLAAIVVYVGLALSIRAYRQGTSRLRVMLRGALVGLIHDQTMAAPAESHEASTPVALVTTDVYALEDTTVTLYIIWANTIEVIIGTAMLARQVGWIWPVPHLITILCSRMSAYVAKNLKIRQTEWNAATRKRISMTASTLASAKSIKMLGMQEGVEQQIFRLRQDEIDKAARVRWIRVIYNASANGLGMFAPVVTLVLFAIIASIKGQSLDPETAFPAIAAISLVTQAANMIMTIIPKAVAAYPSFERIQSYLQPSGLVKGRESVVVVVVEGETARPAIRVRELDVTWESGKKVLQGVSLEVARGEIVACSGPVGAGKTTLARVLLGEAFPSLGGSVEVAAGGVAYCAQTSWLPNRRIKEVIVGPRFEERMDEGWYRTVVRACCLDQDFGELPDGDASVVGDGGMNLSGGQRQRVALARAVFQRCAIAVLDDIFSALDGRTEKQVAENLFGPNGLFRKLGTTVFWITSSTQHFYITDYVVVLDAGSIQEQGPWSELKASEQQISKLIHDNDSSAVIYENNEGKSSSLIKAKVGSQSPVPTATVDTTRGDGDSSLYGYYFSSAGVRNIVFLTTCTFSCAFFMAFAQYWMKWWTQDSRNGEGGRTAFYATGYALMYFVAWVSTNGIMWSRELWVAQTSSIVFHKRLLETILGAPLVYFSVTDAGAILNHFSQDISLVDKIIAPAFQTFITQVFKIITQIGVIFAVQPMITTTLPICISVVYVVQKIYLRTSRQMRIIELESRSAVFTSLLETAQGVETIRAFGWQHDIAAENIHFLDLSQRPFYLLTCLQRWLGVVLNLLGGGIAVGVIFLAVVLKGTTTGAQIGVALNVIIVAKTTLMRMVDSYADLEISLGAISRLRKVDQDTPQEKDGLAEGDDIVVDDSWPISGDLELKNVSASYNEDSLALRDLSLTISPGETVAVCGRTGSGKSSLILSLLRLLNIDTGSITVDGVDLAHISLEVLRQRCFVTIAQDPFFLSDASLRFNLDPSGALSDRELVRILDKVGLWSHLVTSVHNTTQEEGVTTADQTKTNGHDIHTPFLADEQPSYDQDAEAIFSKPFSSLPTLSGGQAQLLALARGIAQCQSPRASQGTIKPKPVILLYEVTSSLDAVTEATVCDIVEEEFVKKGHTVIMVTHKLGPFLAARKRTAEGRERDGHVEGRKGLMVVWMKDGRVEKVEREVA